jgi:hypothetical protein
VVVIVVDDNLVVVVDDNLVNAITKRKRTNEQTMQ